MTGGVPPVISVVGYAKSGKTTFICSLVRVAVAAGMRVAVVKTGRVGHRSEDSSRRLNQPDSERFQEAGAAASVFWSETGVLFSGTVYPPPLPGRDTFRDRWRALLPPHVTRALDASDLIVIEGRLARCAARTVHLVGGNGRKYPVQTHDLVIRSPEEMESAATQLVVQGGNDAG